MYARFLLVKADGIILPLFTRDLYPRRREIPARLRLAYPTVVLLVALALFAAVKELWPLIILLVILRFVKLLKSVDKE